ncbi:MAG: hypothetical protein EON58_19215 [Alphaproteobacteria bacterium]|nr:MAG: hypothetical protein EON58_19215 [Alphaproteobacteria bacterium]
MTLIPKYSQNSIEFRENWVDRYRLLADVVKLQFHRPKLGVELSKRRIKVIVSFRTVADRYYVKADVFAI